MVASFGTIRQLVLYAMTALLTISCGDTARSDADARRRAFQALAGDPVLRQYQFDVSVEKRIAHLRGQIGTSDEEAHALDVVSRTPGVIGVINEMTFSAQIIVEHVKDVLMADPLVAQVPVTITVNNGEVTLRSNQTDAQQRQRMVQLAAGVDGVVHVVDEMK